MAAIAAHRSFLAGIQSRQVTRRAAVDPKHEWAPLPALDGNAEAGPSGSSKGVDYISKANVANYIPEEESIRNDYAAWYGASGEWGSNFVLGAEEGQVCEEFPALKKLMDLKAKLVTSVAHPPLYLQLPSAAETPLNTAIATSLSSNRFDVILITPPPTATWDEIASLPLRSISADPGFVFLWVGSASGDGLERGRETFAKWGFRRAEDIVWVKTNKGRSVADTQVDERAAAGRDQGGLFVGQKEHCLMGIRGTVRRSTDGRFVHCNVDTDIMLWEDSREVDAPRYPPYLHTLIENFCLGTRRLHLFGSPSDVRRGWVTAGVEDGVDIASGEARSDGTGTVRPFDADAYPSQVFRAEDGRPILPFEAEVDNLRPKSPTRKPRNLPNANQSINPRPSHNRQGGAPRFNQSNAAFSPPQQHAMGVPMGFGGQQQQQQAGMYGQQMPFGVQQQFDPNVLAQAQAQAQAQMMQMQMMMQMQAQAQMQAQMQGMMMGGHPGMGMAMGANPGMGVGMAMGGGFGMNQGMQGMGMGMGSSTSLGSGMRAGIGGGGMGSQAHDQPQAFITPISPQPHGGQGEDEDMGENWQYGE